MLFGNVSRLERLPYLNERIKSWITEAHSIASTLPAGTHRVGGLLKIESMMSETRFSSDNVPEVHMDNLDIHIVVNGKENIYFSDSFDLDKVPESNWDNDCCFLPELQLDNKILLSEGDFIIFYPGQVHMPLCEYRGINFVTKAVVKIPKSVFKEVCIND